MDCRPVVWLQEGVPAPSTQRAPVALQPETVVPVLQPTPKTFGTACTGPLQAQCKEAEPCYTMYPTTTHTPHAHHTPLRSCTCMNAGLSTHACICTHAHAHVRTRAHASTHGQVLLRRRQDVVFVPRPLLSMQAVLPLVTMQRCRGSGNARHTGSHSHSLLPAPTRWLSLPALLPTASHGPSCAVASQHSPS